MHRQQPKTCILSPNRSPALLAGSQRHLQRNTASYPEVALLSPGKQSDTTVFPMAAYGSILQKKTGAEPSQMKT